MNGNHVPTRRFIPGHPGVFMTPEEVYYAQQYPQMQYVQAAQPAQLTTTFGAFTNQMPAKVTERKAPKHRVKVAAPVKPKAPIPAPSLYQRELPNIEPAPYPKLPSREQVQALIQEVDCELTILRRQVNELDRSRKSDLMKVSCISDLPPELRLQDYYGVLYSHSEIDKIKEQNQFRIQRVHNQARVVKSRAMHKLSDIKHCPGLTTTMEMHRQIAKPMFDQVFGWSQLVEEKTRRLTAEYMERKAIYDKWSAGLAEYQKQSRESLDIWPPEIEKQPRKRREMAPVLYAASDERMYLDDRELQSTAFHNMNGFVADPVREHHEFKRRIVWTPTEIQTFLDKYRLHPRDFRKISAGIPHKTVKDVIEFYYCHRIDLDLKGLEKQTKKRGRRKLTGNTAPPK